MRGSRRGKGWRRAASTAGRRALRARGRRGRPRVVDHRALAVGAVVAQRVGQCRAPAMRRRGQVRAHGRDAGGGECVGLAMLFVEIAPFGHRQPWPARREDLLAGGVAGRGDDEVRRGDMVGGVIHPAAMLDIGGLGRVPVALDLADRDPACGRARACADADRRLREAIAAAPRQDEDHLFVRADADPLPRDLALGHADIDAEAAGETGPRAQRCVPVGLREVGVEGREQSRRAVIGRGGRHRRGRRVAAP